MLQNYANTHDLKIVNITDEKYLTNLVITGENFETRLRAFYRIKKEDNLIKIAFFSKDNEIREMAVELIEDELALVAIFYIDPCDYVKEAIARKIKNENQLKSIVNNKAFNEYVRAEAVKGIKDEDFLVNVILTDSSNEVREQAANLINDEEILKIIACYDSCWFVRRAAIRKIKDKGFLFSIMYKVDNERIKKIITDKLLLKNA